MEDIKNKYNQVNLQKEKLENRVELLQSQLRKIEIDQEKMDKEKQLYQVENSNLSKKVNLSSE